MNQPYTDSSSAKWKQPKYIAFGIAAVIGIWVLSGLIIPEDRKSGASDSSDSEQTRADNDALEIKLEQMEAVSKAKSLSLNGVSMPQRITLIQAETEGKVEKISGKEGQIVDKNSLLLQLDERDRKTKINEAQALLDQRKVELNASQKLFEKGFQSKVRLAQIKAEVASAVRQLKQAQLDYNYITIRAPYKGLIEEILVEEGDLVGRGFNNQTVMRFVDLSPLKISGQISEQQRSLIHKGDEAEIRFSTGEIVSGKVEFLSSVAEEQTRTFRVEIEVPNEERLLQAGISAEITLQTGNEMSYEVASSVLSLSDSGKVGVLTVDDKGMAKFTEVTVLSQSPKGVWITGLPDRITLVSEGSAFISDGQDVSRYMSSASQPKSTP